MSDIKHEYTSQPICPYCGHEKRDAWEALNLSFRNAPESPGQVLMPP